jgi:hypothetical protein
MAIPTELDTSIQAALLSVLSDAKHDFNWQLRQDLYKTFDKVYQSDIKKTRGWLALFAAEKVLPIFTSFTSNAPSPHNLYPQKLILMTKGIIEDSVNQEIAVELLEDAYHSSDVWGSINEVGDFDFGAHYAAITAYKALTETTLGDDRFLYAQNHAMSTQGGSITFFGGQAPKEGWIRSELFSDFDWARLIAVGDTAGTAAVAFSFGAGSNYCDVKKLKEFWEWWLLEALPKAWEKSHES